MTELRYTADGVDYTGVIEDGSRGRRAPGVLVIHEAGGLGEHARTRARMLADQGYVAFAPDIFGAVPADLKEASAFIADLSTDTAKLRRRCAAALDALRAHGSVDGDRLAAIGFCFGGQAALELARSGADLRATVGFHAGLKSAGRDAAAIGGKILVCLGDRDPLVTRDHRDMFMDEMTEAGVDCQMLLLSGVGHSFTNPDAEAFGVPGCHYHAVADRRSWAAMSRLFDEALG